MMPEKLLLLFFSSVLFFTACKENHTEETLQEELVQSVNTLPTTSERLSRAWIDRRDMSHEVIFAGDKWYDLYNKDTTSVSPYTLYNNYPDKGGQLSKYGEYLQLEESPGNYYMFIIEELDSVSLELNFVTAGQHYSFVSQDAMKAAEVAEVKDSVK